MSDVALKPTSEPPRTAGPAAAAPGGGSDAMSDPATVTQPPGAPPPTSVVDDRLADVSFMTKLLRRPFRAPWTHPADGLS